MSVLLATHGLLLSSGLAQAVTVNFTYNSEIFSEIGAGSLSYNGSGDGTFDITSLSIVSGSNTWNFVTTPSFPDQSPTLANQQITISNNAVTDWQFAGENSSQSELDFGRYFSANFDFEGNGDIAAFSNVYAAYRSSMTPQSQPPENYYLEQWDGQPNSTIEFSAVPVPFEFSPGLGIVALGGLYGASQLKKKMKKIQIWPNKSERATKYKVED